MSIMRPLVLAVALFAGSATAGEEKPLVEIYLPSPCLACIDWGAYLADNGLPGNVGVVCLALIGFFNIIGTWGAGMLGARWTKKYLLAFIYVARSVIIVAFIAVPPTPTSAYLFAAAMGLLWLATVPLTNGIVAQVFGVAYLSMLGGFVFFSHQIGSFLGAWLGGKLYDTTGSYDLVWWISIALGVAAGLINLPIDEREIRRPAAQVA